MTMADTTSPPHGGIPNLGDVITPDDVSTKGTGSYRAEYVNWCRIAHLLHIHAPGWQFHLRSAPDGRHVWEAPNGTAYVVGFFSGPAGEITPDFPQAVMDNRNAPVPMERVSARDVTDSHRRCLCTAAAATFGLAWQLWAREPLEDPHQRPDAAQPAENDRDRLQAVVSKRLKQLGVTGEGLAYILRSQGGPDCRLIGQLPDGVLRVLATGTISAEKVATWNAAGGAATPAAVAEPDKDPGDDLEMGLPEDEEMPMAWGVPA